MGDLARIYEDVILKLIDKLKKQKRPRVYCVAKYYSPIDDKTCYSICNNRKDYQALRSKGAVADIEVLWRSHKFEIDNLKEKVDRFCEERGGEIVNIKIETQAANRKKRNGK